MLSTHHRLLILTAHSMPDIQDSYTHCQYQVRMSQGHDDSESLAQIMVQLVLPDIQMDVVRDLPMPGTFTQFHLRLPTELWDYILDHLWSDLHSLKACSLTCRAWRPTTRYHLFRQLKLSFSRLKELDALASVCSSTSSRLCTYFRELIIYQPIRSAADLITQTMPLLTQLTNIRYIEFYNMHEQDRKSVV